MEEAAVFGYKSVNGFTLSGLFRGAVSILARPFILIRVSAGTEYPAPRA
jgi:hypothetical protein